MLLAGGTYGLHILKPYDCSFVIITTGSGTTSSAYSTIENGITRDTLLKDRKNTKIEEQKS